MTVPVLIHGTCMYNSFTKLICIPLCFMKVYIIIVISYLIINVWSNSAK